MLLQIILPMTGRGKRLYLVVLLLMINTTLTTLPNGWYESWMIGTWLLPQRWLCLTQQLIRWGFSMFNCCRGTLSQPSVCVTSCSSVLMTAYWWNLALLKLSKTAGCSHLFSDHHNFIVFRSVCTHANLSTNFCTDLREIQLELNPEARVLLLK